MNTDLIRGLERARGSVHVGSHLAIDPGDIIEQIEGIRTKIRRLDLMQFGLTLNVLKQLKHLDTQ